MDNSIYQYYKLGRNSNILNVLDICRCTEVLGPGKRYTLWVQGCKKNCVNCGTPEGRSTNINQLHSITGLANDILAQNQIEGITISGGEPFLQANALAELVHLVRKSRDIGVIVFTGYYLKELLESNEMPVNRLLSCIDLLIDGPYQEDMNDNQGLRGSSNQSMNFLTDRYLDCKEYLEYGSRKLEITNKRIVGIKPSNCGILLERVFSLLIDKMSIVKPDKKTKHI